MGRVSGQRGIRRRFLIEVITGASSFVLLAMTLVWRDWVEIIFGIDPDGHSGALEWIIVAVLATAGITLALLAHLDFRRLRAAAA